MKYVSDVWLKRVIDFDPILNELLLLWHWRGKKTVTLFTHRLFFRGGVAGLGGRKSGVISIWALPPGTSYLTSLNLSFLSCETLIISTSYWTYGLKKEVYLMCFTRSLRKIKLTVRQHSVLGSSVVWEMQLRKPRTES